MQNHKYISDTVTAFLIFLLCCLAFLAFNFLWILSQWFGHAIWFIIIPSIFLLLFTALHLIRGSSVSHLVVQIHNKEDFTQQVQYIANDYGYTLTDCNDKLIQFRTGKKEKQKKPTECFEIRLENNNIGVIEGPKYLVEQIEDDLYSNNYKSFNLLIGQ